MGFVTGFTGGVTVTLGVTYLALVAHERNRQAQADMLRSQTRVVNMLAHDPSVPARRSPLAPPEEDDDVLYPPSRAEVAARRRARLVETAKERWNAEIEGAVRWAQTRDWSAAREDAEARLGTLARGVDVERVESRAREVGDGVKALAQETGRRTAGAAGHVRDDAREMVAGAVEKGREAVEKGREAVGKAKAQMFLAEEKATFKVDAKVFHVSEVEKALSERYERREDVMNKSVKEVLAERYKPIDQRDNTRLRGI